MNGGWSAPIVCLGNSITASGWPSILESLLMESGLSDARCVNAGVRGNTSTQGLRRLARYLAQHQPGVVFVEFGFNDSHFIVERPRTTPALFRRNLLAMGSAVRSANALPIFIANHRSLLFDLAPDGRTWEDRSQEYTNITAQVAAETKSDLLDMRVEFPGPGLTLSDALDADGVHLTPAGLAAYARCTADFLLNLT